MINRNILTVDGLYRANYNSNGELDSVNDTQTGATAWVPNHPDYAAESNPLTFAFLTHLQATGESIPLYRADLVATDEP